MEDLEKVLKELRTLKRVPPVSCREYWREVNKIAAEEEATFLAEEKRLTMPENLLHRRFTI